LWRKRSFGKFSHSWKRFRKSSGAQDQAASTRATLRPSTSRKQNTIRPNIFVNKLKIQKAGPGFLSADAVSPAY
jgi:hypothetical protein